MDEILRYFLEPAEQGTCYKVFIRPRAESEPMSMEQPRDGDSWQLNERENSVLFGKGYRSGIQYSCWTCLKLMSTFRIYINYGNILSLHRETIEKCFPCLATQILMVLPFSAAAPSILKTAINTGTDYRQMIELRSTYIHEINTLSL